MKGFSPLVPEYPTKDIRITLGPLHAVALWSLLDRQVDAFDDVKNPTQNDELMLSVWQDLESKLADKLTFRAQAGQK